MVVSEFSLGGRLPYGSQILEVKYEIKCLIDLSTIKTVNDYNTLVGKAIFCDICGREINITYNNVYPIFYINKEYREYVKKKVNIKG